MKRKASLNTIRLRTQLCPGCGAHLEGGTGVDIGSEAGETPPPPVPSEGCIMICIYCGMIGVYGSDLSLRKATKAEEDAALATPHIGDLIRWKRAELAKKAVVRN